MKSILITFLTLFFVQTSFANNEHTLVLGSVPSEVSSAVDFIYELGRHEADSGGISSVDLIENNKGMNMLRVLEQIMFNYDLLYYSSAFPIAEHACYNLAQEDCLVKVLTHNEDVKANYQFHSVFDFISNLKENEFGDEWVKALEVVESYTKEVIGENYSVYSYGYDYVADVFTMIMVSEDESKILVYTGDYGA